MTLRNLGLWPAFRGWVILRTLDRDGNTAVAPKARIILDITAVWERKAPDHQSQFGWKRVELVELLNMSVFQDLRVLI
jgi:hypothetical protein